MGNLFSKRQVTILSIDGGGIRGVIPLKVLQFLEDELEILENGNKQKQEGEASSKKVRLADYFDVIAGTSAGALITSLLALPESIEIDASKQIVGQLPRPRTAEEITELLCDKGPIIFEKETSKQVDGTTTSNQTSKAAPDFVDRFKKKCHDILESAGKKLEVAIKAAVDTVYTGEHLNEVAGELLGKDTLLKDLSTNIVIPTYDVNKLRPVVFTTRLAKEQNSKITLRDIVVSSASAPYFFPPKKFEADGEQYNLVDGGLFANNPTMLAIREASKLFPEAGDYSNYLILSLGTGKEKLSGDRTILTGGIVDWLIGLEAIVALKIKTPPLVDVFFRVSEDVADIMTSHTLGERNLRRNYLRIQDYEMKEEHAEMDNAQKENLENLKKIGNDLISRYVAIPNSETGLPSVIFEEVEEKISPNLLPPKNQDELKRFAKRLYHERRRRTLYKKCFGLINNRSLVAIVALICFMFMVCFGARRVGFI
ncbi:unnamed protein product [Camellia sinensis]